MAGRRGCQRLATGDVANEDLPAIIGQRGEQSTGA